jgi:hypothetical protein
MSKFSAYDVADAARPWGKIRDFLVELPAGRSRYFSVEAHVGVGMKEIWAPIETLARVDPEHMAVTVQVEMDKKMVNHLSRLEAPRKDRDELRLHRLYNTSPDWVPLRRALGGKLRLRSRLMRGSELIGLEVVTRGGRMGRLLDLFFDDKNLALQALRFELSKDGMDEIMDVEAGSKCRLIQGAHALYLDVN